MNFTNDAFIGLVLPAGQMLLDTGAQEGLIGPEHLARHEEVLERHGLKARWLNRDKTTTGGVGGNAQVLGMVEIPVGIQKKSGLITMKVTENPGNDLPPLIPMPFCRQLGCTLDSA